MNTARTNKPPATSRLATAKGQQPTVSPAKKPFLMKGQGRTIATAKTRMKSKQEEKKPVSKAPTPSLASESDLSRALSSSHNTAGQTRSVHQRAMSTALKNQGEQLEDDSDLERDTAKVPSKDSGGNLLLDLEVATQLVPGEAAKAKEQQPVESKGQQQDETEAEKLNQRRPRSSRRGSAKSGAFRPSSTKNMQSSSSINNLNSVGAFTDQQSNTNIIVKNILPQGNLRNNIEQILATTSSNDIIRL